MKNSETDIDVQAARSERALTVSGVNERLRAAVEEAFPGPFWVRGELSGYDRGKHGKHLYFELAEKDPGRPQAKSKIRAVIWAGKRLAIERKLAGPAGKLELQDGIEVLLLCRLDLYVPHGSYQLIVEDIDPSYTFGKLAMDREAILRRLAEMNLMELNRSRPLADVPLRVGLITRFESAAFNDFKKELFNSGLAFRVSILDCAMQGQETEESVVKALREFGRRDELDVVVICRGGGSKTDLAWFDNLAIGEAIARCPHPVVTGIGHEIDRTIADDVAHTSVKTPTAAAQFLIERVGGWMERFEGKFFKVLDIATEIVGREGERLSKIQRSAIRDARRFVALEKEKFERRRSEVLRGAKEIVKKEGSRLPEIRKGVVLGAQSLVSLEKERFERKRFAVLRGAREKVQKETARLPEIRKGIVLGTRRRIEAEGKRRGYCEKALVQALEGRTKRETANIRTMGRGLLVGVGAAMKVERSRLRERIAARFPPAADVFFKRRIERLEHLSEKRALIDPARVLQRGYTITKDAEGRILKRASQVRPGDLLITRFADGEARSRAESAEKRQPAAPD